MKIVAFVPIKLNNERLPNKNILPLDGKPLCRHLLDTLMLVHNLNEIYVFCSDQRFKAYLPDGVRFLQREKDLDAFTAKHYDIVRSFVSKVDADVYVNAHVTNPFISAKTIEIGISKVLDEGFDSALAVLEMREHLWRGYEPFNFKRDDPPQTQNLEPLYAEVGLFIYKKEVFTQTQTRYGEKPYFIRFDKIEAIDINYADDYELAKAVCTMRNQKNKR
jgi:CMP-N-acetylneuraminic acid synthetase